MSEKTSGSAGPDNLLFAPGLKRRRRANGEALYWIPPQKDIARGFAPKSLTLDPSLTEAEVAARCRILWRDLEAWRSGAPLPVRHTIGWLIDRYLGDQHSPFQKLGGRAKRGYRQCCSIIKDSVGERRIDPVLEGGVLRPRVTGEDVRRWHLKWGEGVVKTVDSKLIVGPARPSRARHLIVQLRIIASYGVEIAMPGAPDFRVLLKTMRFPTTQPRESAPTRSQVHAIVTAARDLGFLSIATATLAQFELIERRAHIIGTWEDGRWRSGWTWNDISKDWVIAYHQNKSGRVLRQFDLKTVAALLELLQQTPPERRVGPVIICETTGSPWTESFYATVFRQIRAKAGVPASIYSMDMRAGGATEADATDGVSDRALQDAGGWKDPRSRDRYRRGKQRNAQNVVVLRQAAREK